MYDIKKFGYVISAIFMSDFTHAMQSNIFYDIYDQNKHNIAMFNTKSVRILKNDSTFKRTKSFFI